jgi:NitT/TauT family transport system permease protein
MINTVQQIVEPVSTAERQPANYDRTRPISGHRPLGKIIAFPTAAIIAAAVHSWASRGQPAVETQPYFILLGGSLGVGLLLGILQRFSPGLSRWLQHMGPILAGAIGLLALWETLTSGLGLLPLPYFPGPAGVLRILIDERMRLLNDTWDSSILLFSGYGLGATLGFITGVCIGWYRTASYWGMPLLKIVGPIPATAWIPLAMVLSPSTRFSSIGVIALAVWFPVTMLTASAISNTRASYLDVARTLGASESFLILRVAIPAAMPSIFIGLFMGLGTSFLTLMVAESVGVHGGLGYYMDWARNYAEYKKVYAALIIMAVFFSTIMTLLFKVRDRVLVWQKGVIKW